MAEAALRSAGDLSVEEDIEAMGVREWLPSLAGRGGVAAAFDTRVEGAPVFTGRASRGIAKALVQDGYTMVAEPESFLVDSSTRLLNGEIGRAREWGIRVAALAEHTT